MGSIGGLAGSGRAGMSGITAPDPGARKAVLMKTLVVIVLHKVMAVQSCTHELDPVKCAHGKCDDRKSTPGTGGRRIFFKECACTFWSGPT
eukprot:126260-Pelagomonas_calceolata.AAC.1